MGLTAETGLGAAASSCSPKLLKSSSLVSSPFGLVELLGLLGGGLSQMRAGTLELALDSLGRNFGR